MKRISIAIIIAIFFLAACGDKTSKLNEKFDLLSKEVKSEFAPDSRVKTFEPILEKVGKTMVLKGSTTEIQAKENLIKRMSEENISILDSMVVLPDPRLGEKTYGITNLSVINIRMKPGYAEESGTQTLLGMPLRILENKGGWLRIQTPEGYLAWVTEKSVVSVDKNEFEKWMKSPKWIINTYYTILRSEPKDNSTVVSDGVWGGIVVKDGQKGKYYKVILPDGKTAYLLKEHAEDFNKWIESRNPNPENIISTAKGFLGFPYMWGGTSIKGMDCSGFTKTTFYLNGIILERDASQQAYTGVNIDITNGLDNLTPGDLLFFGRKATLEKKEKVSHVAIYLGNGEFIHCATYVRINSLLPNTPNYYEGSTRLIRAQRILGNQDTGNGIVSISNHPWYSIK